MARRKHSSESGVTLMELMIAITLVAMLSTGLLMAMRTSLLTYDKVQKRLDVNRRSVSVQQILSSQLSGAMTVEGLCPSSVSSSSSSSSPSSSSGNPPRPAYLLFFNGDDRSLRFVTNYSIAEGALGLPQIVEYQVQSLPGGAVQLVVAEHAYTGEASMVPYCQDLQFRPVDLGGGGLVLAGPLASCRFVYHPAFDAMVFQEKPWLGFWAAKDTPLLPGAVRIEMTEVAGGSASGLPVPSITVPIRADRSIAQPAEDEY